MRFCIGEKQSEHVRFVFTLWPHEKEMARKRACTTSLCYWWACFERAVRYSVRYLAFCYVWLCWQTLRAIYSRRFFDFSFEWVALCDQHKLHFALVVSKTSKRCTVVTLYTAYSIVMTMRHFTNENAGYIVRMNIMPLETLKVTFNCFRLLSRILMASREREWWWCISADSWGWH